MPLALLLTTKESATAAQIANQVGKTQPKTETVSPHIRHGIRSAHSVIPVAAIFNLTINSLILKVVRFDIHSPLYML